MFNWQWALWKPFSNFINKKEKFIWWRYKINSINLLCVFRSEKNAIVLGITMDVYMAIHHNSLSSYRHVIRISDRTSTTSTYAEAIGWGKYDRCFCMWCWCMMWVCALCTIELNEWFFLLIDSRLHLLILKNHLDNIFPSYFIEHFRYEWVGAMSNDESMDGGKS